MIDKMDAIVERIYTAVAGFVKREIGALGERLDAIETRVAQPGPEGPRGADGAPGADGRDGVDGKDGEPGPPGEKGADGRDGIDGVNGKDGAPGPQGEKGLDGQNGIDGKDGAPGAEGRDGRDGKAGPPGRDAIELDILETFDSQRQYARGTVVRYRGGLIRARRLTDPLKDGDLEEGGWSVILNGIAELAVEHGDDLRTFSLVTRGTDGKEYRTAVTIPVVLYAGTYEDGREYQRGDQVTDSGSQWIAVETTSERPRNSKAWRLSTKKGNDGKDATAPGSVNRDPVRLR